MLKIYGVPISVHTRKVVVVSIIKDLPYEVIPVVPVIPGNPPANWHADCLKAFDELRRTVPPRATSGTGR